MKGPFLDEIWDGYLYIYIHMYVYVYIYIYMSSGSYLVKWRIVLFDPGLSKTSYLRSKNEIGTLEEPGRHRTKKTNTLENEVRPKKHVTGLENEVGTPSQLCCLPNDFRGSEVYIYIYKVCNAENFETEKKTSGSGDIFWGLRLGTRHQHPKDRCENPRPRTPRTPRAGRGDRLKKLVGQDQWALNKIHAHTYT